MMAWTLVKTGHLKTDECVLHDGLLTTYITGSTAVWEHRKIVYNVYVWYV